MMEQLRNYRICQLCGTGTPADHADGWLVSPRRSDPGILVIRCPAHISEWALRQSQAGRTKQMRQMMREGADWEPQTKIGVEPVPLFDPDE